MWGLDELLSFLFFVPAPLRKGLALCISALLILAFILTFSEDYGYREAIWSTAWLSAGGFCSFGLVILALAKLRAWQLIRWSVIFLAAAGTFTVGAIERSQYVYNELGFYQSRAWTKSKKQPDDIRVQAWEWEISAVKDLTKVPVIVQLQQADTCRFGAFWPVNVSPDYTPNITDVSQDAKRMFRWRIQDLRRPATLIFVLLTTVDKPMSPQSCSPQIFIGSGP